MIYIDGSSPFNRLSIDSNDKNLVRLINPVITDCDNWGDDDCIKMVSSVETCDIFIDKSIADQFASNNFERISFIRYNYYRPAFCITGHKCSREYDDKGNLIYHVAA